MAACQTEPAFDVNMGDGTTTISVVLPEDAITRAGGTNSASDGLANTSGETLRVIFQVYDEKGVTNNNLRQVKYLTEGEFQANFDVRLVPGRDYTFVAWADQVDATTKENNYFDVTNLENVQIVNWEAMDESRDAYTATHTETNFSSASDITLELKRPFAKLRVVTTDMAELGYLGITPYKAEFAYSVALPNAFNAFAGEVCATSEIKTFTYDIAAYSADAANTKTLFSDYILVPADGIVKFTMDTQEASGRTIKENAFTTDIPVKRNNLTTIMGNILTDGDNIKVEVKPEFDNGSDWNPATDNKDIQTISSEAELVAAANTGRKYIIISDFNVTGATASTLAATRATEAKTTIIDLNGKTITVNNQGTNAVINLGVNTLIFSGEGNIVAENGSSMLVEGGNVYVTGTATVDDDAAEVKPAAETLKYVVNNGGEFTLTKDIEVNESLEATTANDIVINGNGKTIKVMKSNTGRFIDVKSDANGANLTLKNLTIENNVSWIERIVNYNTNGNLTLENVKIVNAEGCSNNYAINLPASSDNVNVAITNSEIWAGANALNLWGEKTTANIIDSKLYVVDSNAVEGYSVVSLNNGGENAAHYSVVNVEGGEIKVVYKGEGATQPSSALRDATVGSEINISDTTVVVGDIKIPVANVIYEGYNEFYSFTTVEAAIAKVQADKNGTVVLIKDLVLTEKINVKASDHMVVLDLNGHNMHMVDTIEPSFAMINNAGKLTIQGKGKLSVEATINRGWNAYSSVISNTVGGNLTVKEGVVIEHLGGTDMAYGIDNLTNGKGTYAVATIDGATVKSTYSAIRQFLNGVEATNELYVKAGSTLVSPNRSIFFQDPSKNANTGKLVVEAGASVTGDVRLSVTEGSKEWPVEVSVAASALVNGSEVTYGYIPAGYVVETVNGVWTVNTYTEVSTADELVAALEANKSVYLMNDIKIDPAAMSNAYGKTGINVKNGQTINGGGHTLNIKGAGGTWDSGINTTGGIIRNITVTGSFRGIFINHTSTHSEKVILENVTIGGNGTVYTISCDQGLYQGIEATNCTFNGWTSFAKTAGEAKFVNCTFGEGSGYKFCRPYSNTEFVNCTFCPGYAVDETQAKVTFTDCTWEK
ncbi:MAG: hypothetical protein J6R01_03255 [Alistipes sp.]|nr:hypothetical protein [Alistipes sp.]